MPRSSAQLRYIGAVKQTAENESLGPALRNIGSICIDECDLDRMSQVPTSSPFTGISCCNNLRSFTHSVIHTSNTSEHVPRAHSLFYDMFCDPKFWDQEGVTQVFTEGSEGWGKT